MKITGIICEYNPFHKGHLKQFQKIREKDPDESIVCLMSGNFVQRGYPAIFDKEIRAKMAILSGADLVLELPVTTVLSSAEGFAAGGVRILSGFCDKLSFGAESDDPDSLPKIAKAIIDPTFTVYLKQELDKGLSFPAARQNALENLGFDGSLLNQPNNILAIEYCKAILSQNANLKPDPILRQGDYHSTTPDTDNPSATSLRLIMEKNMDWTNYVPDNIKDCYHDASIHSLQNGESAILYKLRTMSDAEFEKLPFGSEGLWRKLMKNSRQYSTLEEILTHTKSKRYTRTRLDRMVMCAFLGLTSDDLCSPAPYTRVLALNDRGREIIRKARQTGIFPNIGEQIDHPYQSIENRCDDLYGLFSTTPEQAGLTSKRRIYYTK